MGEGFAGPVLAGGKLLLFHRQNNQEILEALDPATGKRLWAESEPTSYRDDFGFDEGPRSAPAVDAAGRVFAYGAEGFLRAVDLATGKRLWGFNAMQRYQAPKNFFGAAGTPLVAGDRILLNIGGPSGAGIIAFDAATGRELWRATNDGASYSSGVLARIHGRPLALFLTREGFVALEPETGKVAGKRRWRARSNASVNAASPVASGNEVFLSASYGTGAILLEAGPEGWRELWSGDDSLSNHYAASVLHGGFLYGFHGRQETGQALRCVEWKTGKVRWSLERFGAGTVQMSDGRLAILRENGEFLLAAPSPAGFKPQVTVKLLDGTVRAYPALQQDVVYARNEKVLAAFRISTKP